MSKIKSKFGLVELGISVAAVVGLSFGTLAFLTSLAETDLKKEIEAYKFTEGTFLEGTKIRAKDVSCPYLSNRTCHVIDAVIYNKKTNGETIDIFTAKEIIIKKTKQTEGSFFIEANGVDIEKDLKESIFLKYDDKELVSIGENLYKNIFPFNISVDSDSTILKKNLADIVLKMKLENNILKTEAEAKFIVKNEPYTEVLEVKKEDPNKPGEFVISEMRGDFPNFVKLDTMSYSLENKNIADLLFNFYNLNILNFKNNPANIMAFNNFYLGALTEQPLTFYEFSQRLPIRIAEFAGSVPNEKESLREHIYNLAKIFDKERKTLILIGKNVDGSSVEKLNMSLNLIDYRDRLDVIYNGYDIKTETK